MADEQELIAEREKKVAELRARGVNPYANGFAPTDTAEGLRELFLHWLRRRAERSPSENNAVISLWNSMRPEQREPNRYGRLFREIESSIGYSFSSRTYELSDWLPSVARLPLGGAPSTQSPLGGLLDPNAPAPTLEQLFESFSGKSEGDSVRSPLQKMFDPATGGDKPSTPTPAKQGPLEEMFQSALASQSVLTSIQSRDSGLQDYVSALFGNLTGGREGYFDAVMANLPPDQDDVIADKQVRVAGRIVQFRSFGKAAFAKVLDRTGEIQIWIKKDRLGDDLFDVWKLIERGDFVGVTGIVVRTKTNEVTVLADAIKLLTKATRPLPEKFHGLSDQEIRYRQRYVDLVVNPDVREVFRKRSAIVRGIRRFLDARGFQEVETPMMHSIVGGAAAKPFRTHHNALDLDLNMRIAPELHLKRLVVGSLERVYEIGRNFRNEGLSRQHNPEFTMLEFYQAYATYEDLIVLTEQLFRELAREVCGTETITYQGQQVNLGSPWPRIPMKDAIVTASERGILPRGLERAVLDEEKALAAWLDSVGLLARSDEISVVLRKADSHGERIGALFDHAGEKALPADQPAFVTEYPAETSPLSRRNDADPGKVDRFELFIVGREHANAFSELNDPADQRARFQRQVDAKAKGADETMDFDEDYCRALEYGLPPTAGEGIGIDRLVMLLADQPSIRDVILFPLMRPEQGE